MEQGDGSLVPLLHFVLADKELDPWPFEKKLERWELLKEEQTLSLSEIQTEIDRICDVCKQYLVRKERLKQIFVEIESIYKQS